MLVHFFRFLVDSCFQIDIFNIIRTFYWIKKILIIIRVQNSPVYVHLEEKVCTRMPLYSVVDVHDFSRWVIFNTNQLYRHLSVFVLNVAMLGHVQVCKCSVLWFFPSIVDRSRYAIRRLDRLLDFSWNISSFVRLHIHIFQ